jgi:hypothetical protein
LGRSAATLALCCPAGSGRPTPSSGLRLAGQACSHPVPSGDAPVGLRAVPCRVPMVGVPLSSRRPPWQNCRRESYVLLMALVAAGRITRRFGHLDFDVG